MDHEKTLKLLAKALEIAPGDWETRSHMATLCIDLGMVEKAVTLLDDAPALPDDPAGKLHAAELFARADADSAALRIADDLITDNKANAKAHLLKARIYRTRGMEPEARKHYNVAAVIDVSLEDAEFEAWLDGTSFPKSGTSADVSGQYPAPSEFPPQPVLRENDSDCSADGPPYKSPLDDIDPDPPSGYPDDGWINESAEIAAEFGEEDEFREIDVNLASPDITFADIGGMEAIKERVRMKLIYPSKNKGVFEKFNRRAGGGLLLYGPPGCGKTAIAQAAAGECGSRFIEVSVADVLSKWFGESERRIRDLFDIARSNAPAVVFIDEIDALGVKRSDASGAMAGLVNVLLGEIDRTSSHNTDILIIGATNTPWRVDSSFRRPGRFDQTIFVPPPDSEARASILELLLRNIPTTGIETASLVEATHKFSGADLRAAVDTAIETAITEEMKTGNDTRLSAQMLMAAIKAARPTTLEWLEQAANYASYANASGLYDDLAAYLKDHS